MPPCLYIGRILGVPVPRPVCLATLITPRLGSGVVPSRVSARGSVVQAAIRGSNNAKVRLTYRAIRKRALQTHRLQRQISVRSVFN